MDHVGIIVLTFNGVCGLEEFQRAKSDLSREIQESGFRRLLIDNSGGMPAKSIKKAEIIELAAECQADFSAFDLRAALVLPEDPYSRTQNEFFEIAAFNRGVIIHPFQSFKDAQNWLTSVVF